jgi:primase-polymerase (primpol)-like protein
MAERACERCTERLPFTARADARYCSTRCRVAAHRACRRVPVALRDRGRWVRRSAKKIPMMPSGKFASSTNPTTWSTLEDAGASQRGTGLGFVLNGDGIVCLDLDHCLEDGELAAWARPIIEALPSTWIEISPSGDGLHVWGLGDAETGRVLPVDGGKVEIYSQGRYITVTETPWKGAPLHLADLRPAVRTLIDAG